MPSWEKVGLHWMVVARVVYLNYKTHALYICNPHFA